MVLMKGKPGKSDKKSWQGPAVGEQITDAPLVLLCICPQTGLLLDRGASRFSVVGVWLVLPTSAVRPTAHPPNAHLAFHQPAFQHLDKLKLST